jgi:hypothetical protein
MTLSRRLRTARERLDAAGRAALEHRSALRDEAARTDAAIFEAEHAHRLAALQLRSAARARHRMAGETGAVVGQLVTYEPPRTSPVGRVAPESGIRWKLLAGILTGIALLLVASDAHARRTPLSEAAIAQALVAGHRDVFGEAPSSARLTVARAQVGLEVGRGKACWCHNLGNVGARKGGCLTRGGFRVARYASPREGARAYWRLRAVRKALPWFDAGDARGAALALGRAGYYTADPEVYAERMTAVWRELGPWQRR